MTTTSPQASIIAAADSIEKLSCLRLPPQPSVDQASPSAAAASSNCCSSQGDIPLSPATTFFAHSMYSSRRLTDQSAAGLDAMVHRLLVLSASLAPLLFFG